MKPTLLFISPTFFPNTYFGGTIYSSLRLCKDLSNYFDVITLTTNQQNKKKSKYNNIYRNMHNFKVLYCAEEITGYFSFNFFIQYFRNIHKAQTVYINDFFSLYGFISIFLSLSFKKKVIFAPRGTFSHYTLNRSKIIIKKIMIFILKYTFNKNINFSFHATSNLEEKEILNLHFKNKIYVIPNLFDTKKYSIVFSGLKRRNKKIRFVYFGRIDPKKNIQLFIDLSNNFRNYSSKIEFIIAGENTFYTNSDFRNLILSSNCTYIGHLNFMRKFKFIINSDLLFSISENENFGNSSFEFLLANKSILIDKNNFWNNFKDKNIISVNDTSLTSLTYILNKFINEYSPSITSESITGLFSLDNREIYKKFFL